jgi:hypothetical protein
MRQLTLFERDRRLRGLDPFGSPDNSNTAPARQTQTFEPIFYTLSRGVKGTGRLG